jgi:hypothetical protein
MKNPELSLRRGEMILPTFPLLPIGETIWPELHPTAAQVD